MPVATYNIFSDMSTRVKFKAVDFRTKSSVSASIGYPKTGLYDENIIYLTKKYKLKGY